MQNVELKVASNIMTLLNEIEHSIVRDVQGMLKVTTDAIVALQRLQRIGRMMLGSGDQKKKLVLELLKYLLARERDNISANQFVMMENALATVIPAAIDELVRLGKGESIAKQSCIRMLFSCAACASATAPPS